jgi:AAA domain
MSDTVQVPELVVIVGPIASGKSTIAHELGRRFRAAGRPVAVLDVDDVVNTIGGFTRLTPGQFHQAQSVLGELIGAWLRRGFDVVAHGPFFEPEEDRAVLHGVPGGILPRRVVLLSTYGAALERTALDSGRTVSKDPEFLRAAYDRVASLFPGLPSSTWSFDTTSRSSQEIVDVLAAELLGDRS